MKRTLPFVVLLLVACGTSSPPPATNSPTSPAPEARAQEAPSGSTTSQAAPQSASGCPDCYDEGQRALEAGESSEAIRIFEKGCVAGDGRSCIGAFKMYADGNGVPEDDLRAMDYAMRACDLGMLNACGIGDDMLKADLGPERHAQARAALEKGCAGGIANDCLAVGAEYVLGKGGPVDQAKAVGFWRRACDLGSGRGCQAYGNSLVAGDVVEKDDAAARAVFERGCSLGAAHSCTWTGQMLRDGVGGPVDVQNAALAFERGCEGGSMSACTSLGAMLTRGDDGIEVDLDRAELLFVKACDGGSEAACRNLEARERQRAWEKSAPTSAPSWKTTFGSLDLGVGDEAIAAKNVGSTCNAIQLMAALGAAAGPVGKCMQGQSPHRVGVTVGEGKITSARADPNDEVANCILQGLGSGPLRSLSCEIEATFVPAVP